MYRHIEQLRSRKHEKVALFLTAENMAGLLVMVLPVYLGTATMSSPVLRFILLAAAAVIGLATTLQVNGLAFYERILWRVRGWVRVRVTGGVIHPSTFTNAPITKRQSRVLRLDGPIQVMRLGAGPFVPPTQTIRSLARNQNVDSGITPPDTRYLSQTDRPAQPSVGVRRITTEDALGLGNTRAPATTVIPTTTSLVEAHADLSD